MEARRIPYALSPKGNPAATTLAGLSHCIHRKVLLIDCDCTFEPGAIERIYLLAKSADIVRPTVDFEALDWSSYATQLARHFQYTYRGFVYEPGLLLRLDRLLPYIGGYLFTPFAPYTPDGELDYRIRQIQQHIMLNIVTDPKPTLVHASLGFSRHLRSYWRYGLSEASRMIYLRQPVLSEVIGGLAYRYRMAWSRKYRFPTGILIMISDLVYICSIVIHWLALPRRRQYERSRNNS